MLDAQTRCSGSFDGQRLDIEEGRLAIDLRLTLTEQVEVGPVDHEDRGVVHALSMPSGRVEQVASPS